MGVDQLPSSMVHMLHVFLIVKLQVSFRWLANIILFQQRAW